jgi:hypothetical protein
MIHVEEEMIRKTCSMSMVLRRPIEASHKIKGCLRMKLENKKRWCIKFVSLEYLRTFHAKSMENLADE